MKTSVANPVLSAEGVTFAFGAHRVLEDVELEVSPGEFTALVGPNGAGKSTLLRIVLGLLTPQAGRVEVFGASPRRFADRWRLGYVPQRPRLAPDLPATVEEVVAAGRLAKQGWWRGARPADREAVEPRARVGRARRAAHAAGRRALGRATAARADRQGTGQRARAARARRADRGGRRAVAAAVPRLARAPGARPRRRGRCSSRTSSARWPTTSTASSCCKRRVLFDGKPGDLAATGVSLGVHRDDLPRWLEELTENGGT